MKGLQENESSEGRRPQPHVPYVFDDGYEYSLHFLPPDRAEANMAADAVIAAQYNIFQK